MEEKKQKKHRFNSFLKVLKKIIQENEGNEEKWQAAGGVLITKVKITLVVW